MDFEIAVILVLIYTIVLEFLRIIAREKARVSRFKLR